MFHPRRSCSALHHRKYQSLTVHNLCSITPLTALCHPHHPLFLKFWPGILGIGTRCFTLGWTVGGISACTLIWVDHFRVWIKLTLLSIIILPNWSAHQCKISLTSLTHFSIVGTSSIKVKSTLLITFFSWHQGRWSCSHFFGAWIINRPINVLNSVVQKQHKSW